MLEEPRNVSANSAAKSTVDRSLSATAPPDDLEATGAYTGQTVLTASIGAAPGRYEVVHSHAHGGLGEVFIARDTELNRPVALKRIREQHVGSADCRRRFLVEAEITARLEHPGIVPVYGLVADELGQPSYAMRFIEGESLHEASRRFHQAPRTQATRTTSRFASLEFRQLLQRFTAVCNTIAYAHSRGVIHRDIKPANVMLGKYGETLVVDWGLAKWRDRPESADAQGSVAPSMLSGDSLDERTQMGQTIGTPAFMSPEQAEGRWDTVGPASDVYSLGATLYTLLAGSHPFADSQPPHVFDKIQQGQFPHPRSRCPDVPVVLEAICLKAMARDPGARYGSPLDLARDVELWLADEATTACRERWPARTGRWLRKRRTLVTTVAVAGLLLLTGSIAGTLVLGDKNRTLAKAKQDADSRRIAAEKATAEAKANFGEAIEAFNELVFSTQDYLETLPGSQDLRKQLLVKAQTGLKRLVVEGETGGVTISSLTWAHLRMGDAYRLVGDPQKAQAEFDIAFARAERAVAIDPNNLSFQRDLSISYNKRADMARANGRMQEALALYGKKLEIDQRRVEVDPKDAQAWRDLSWSYLLLGDTVRDLGRVADALDYYKKKNQIDQRLIQENQDNIGVQREFAFGVNRLGEIEAQLGQMDAAITHLRQRLMLAERLTKQFPFDIQLQRDVVEVLWSLGDLMVRQRKYNEAYDLLTRCHELSRRMAEREPSNFHFRLQLIASLDSLGTAAWKIGKSEEGVKRHLQALEMRKADSDASPANVDLLGRLAASYDVIAFNLLDDDRPNDAEQYALANHRIRKQLAEKDPENRLAQHQLACACHHLGRVYVDSKRIAEGFEWFRRDWEIAARLIKVEPANLEFRRQAGFVLVRLGLNAASLEPRQDPMGFFEKARPILEQVLKDNPDDYEANMLFALCQEWLGRLHRDRGQTRESFEVCQRGLDLLQSLTAAKPSSAMRQRYLAHAYENLAGLHEDALDYAKASPWHEKTIALIRNRPDLKTEGLALEDYERRLFVCRNAEQAVAQMEFAFEQKPEYVWSLLEARLKILLARGRLADAIATAERFAVFVEQDKYHSNGSSRYNSACLFGLCAKAAEKERGSLAVKAVQLLRRAQTVGYFSEANLSHMLQDRDLDVLRDRTDFKKLVEDVKAQKK